MTLVSSDKQAYKNQTKKPAIKLYPFENITTARVPSPH